MFPKKGNKLHRAPDDFVFAQLISDALTLELGRTHQAIKTVIRWTGASERCVKHWFAGDHAPSGAHLIALMRHCDTVFKHVLIAADRSEVLIGLDAIKLRECLETLLHHLDKGTPSGEAIIAPSG